MSMRLLLVQHTDVHSLVLSVSHIFHSLAHLLFHFLSHTHTHSNLITHSSVCSMPMACMSMKPLFLSPTHAHSFALSHSFIHSLTHSITHSMTCSHPVGTMSLSVIPQNDVHLLTHYCRPLPHPTTNSLTQSLTHLCAPCP